MKCVVFWAVVFAFACQKGITTDFYTCPPENVTDISRLYASISASSEEATFPVEQIVSAFGTMFPDGDFWCIQVGDVLPQTVDFIYNEPVVLVELESSAHQNNFVNNFSVQYFNNSFVEEAVSYQDFVLTMVPTSFNVSSAPAVSRVRFLARDSATATACWHLTIRGCFSSQAVKVVPPPTTTSPSPAPSSTSTAPTASTSTAPTASTSTAPTASTSTAPTASSTPITPEPPTTEQIGPRDDTRTIILAVVIPCVVLALVLLLLLLLLCWCRRIQKKSRKATSTYRSDVITYDNPTTNIHGTLPLEQPQADPSGSSPRENTPSPSPPPAHDHSTSKDMMAASYVPIAPEEESADNALGKDTPTFVEKITFDSSSSSSEDSSDESS